MREIALIGDRSNQSSGWDDSPSSTMTPPERNVKLSELDTECPDAPQQPQDRDEGM